jgi:hypothetical protein
MQDRHILQNIPHILTCHSSEQCYVLTPNFDNKLLVYMLRWRDKPLDARELVWKHLRTVETEFFFLKSE